MICKNCGRELPDGVAFCTYCGARQGDAQQPAQPQYQQPVQPQYQQPAQSQYQQPVQPQYQQPVQPQYQQPVQPQYQQPVQPQYQQPVQPQYQQPVQPQYQQPQFALPMKWHKFLIYFSLWASAVVNIISGLMMMTGASYSVLSEADAQLVYAAYSGLQICDIFIGILMIGAGVFAIITRFHLAKYKRTGPKMLLAVYGINSGISLIYMLITMALVGPEMLSTTTISNVITSVIMIFANNAYYKKRAFMFVN